MKSWLGFGIMLMALFFAFLASLPFTEIIFFAMFIGGAILLAS